MSFAGVHVAALVVVVFLLSALVGYGVLPLWIGAGVLLGALLSALARGRTVHEPGEEMGRETGPIDVPDHGQIVILDEQPHDDRRIAVEETLRRARVGH